jgi:ubiquinone/menaquinone biosynthesis C-methylase UbiE
MDKEGNIIFNQPINDGTLLLHSNGIWRCYWSYQQNKWIPREIRTDKIVPNYSYIVTELTNMHIRPWLPTDLISHMPNDTYYTHKKILDKNINSNSITDMLELFHLISKNRIDELINEYSIKTICDIGCGQSKYLELHKMNKIKYVGLDIDPVSITLNKEKTQKNNNLNWLWSNINKPDWSSFKDPILSQLQKNSVDLIIVRNSINYANNLSTFISDIASICKKNTVIYILMFDANAITDINSEHITIKKQSINQNEQSINQNKQTNDKYMFRYSWRDNGAEFYDTVYKCTDVQTLLSANNFTITKIYSFPTDLMNTQHYVDDMPTINAFIQSHKIIEAVFKIFTEHT